MLYGCECGEYDCSYCGPILSRIHQRNELNRIKEENKEKARIRHETKLFQKCSKYEMPYGKYKGYKIINLSPAYCRTLLSYQNQRDRLDSVLIELLEFIASKYDENIKSANLYSNYFEDIDYYDSDQLYDD